METREMEYLYQKIGTAIVNIIPEDWDKVYVYAELDDGYENIFFYYYPRGELVPTHSLDITDNFDISSSEFRERVSLMHICFRKLRKGFKKQEHEPWTYLTFILDSNGNMKVEYGYDDVSEISPVEKKKNWKRKYLGI